MLTVKTPTWDFVYFLVQVDANTEEQYTFSDLIDRIQRCAAGLQKIGFRQGDVLCAITFNTIEYHVIWYGLTLLGGTLQTASPLYTDGKSKIIERITARRNKPMFVTPSSIKHMIRIRNKSYHQNLNLYVFLWRQNPNF